MMNKEVRAEFFRFRASEHYLTGVALTNCIRVDVPADSYDGHDERDTAARSRHVLQNRFRKTRASVAQLIFAPAGNIFLLKRARSRHRSGRRAGVRRQKASHN